MIIELPTDIVILLRRFSKYASTTTHNYQNKIKSPIRRKFWQEPVIGN